MKAPHDRIILAPISQTIVTSAGIQFSLPIENGLKQGLVVAVGKGRLKDTGEYLAPAVKVGETVLIHENAGAELQNEDGTFLVIRDSEILAVLDAENPTQH